MNLSCIYAIADGLGGVDAEFDDDVYDALPREAAVMAIDAVWRDGIERDSYSLKQNRQRKSAFASWEAALKRYHRAKKARTARARWAGWKARQAVRDANEPAAATQFTHIAPTWRTGGDRKATVSIPHWLDVQRREVVARLAPWGADWGARLRVTEKDPTLAGLEFDFDAARFGNGHFVKELAGFDGWFINVEDKQGRRWWVNTDHVEVLKQ